MTGSPGWSRSSMRLPARRAFTSSSPPFIRNYRTSHLYAFADHNQVFYARSAKPPIDEDAFLLTMNCRNTRIIHDAAYRYYAGAATEAPSISGAPIEIVVANSIDAQVTRIAAAVTKLIMDEQVAPEDIAILVVRDSKQLLYGALSAKPLP